jgi:2-C-methyl-D-erythritol 4-phosphate cytidylyltransferase
VADAHTATDEAELVQRNGVSVRVVHGSPLNRKITTKGDLRFAEIALSVLPKKSISGPAHPFGDDDMWR